MAGADLFVRLPVKPEHDATAGVSTQVNHVIDEGSSLNLTANMQNPASISTTVYYDRKGRPYRKGILQPLILGGVGYCKVNATIALIYLAELGVEKLDEYVTQTSSDPTQQIKVTTDYIGFLRERPPASGTSAWSYVRFETKSIKENRLQIEKEDPQDSEAFKESEPYKMALEQSDFQNRNEARAFSEKMEEEKREIELTFLAYHPTLMERRLESTYGSVIDDAVLPYGIGKLREFEFK